MISFQPTEEQELVRDAMREFAENALRPVARECDEAESVPDDLLQEAWSLGLTSTQLPEEHGGLGEERSVLVLGSLFAPGNEHHNQVEQFAAERLVPGWNYALDDQ